jgi:hypothetical protein
MIFSISIDLILLQSERQRRDQNEDFYSASSCWSARRRYRLSKHEEAAISSPQSCVGQTTSIGG